MKLGDPKKLRDANKALDNLCYCIVAAGAAFLIWGYLLLFGVLCK